MADKRIYDMKVQISSLNRWVRVGCVMERSQDGKLYALVKRDINFAGFDVPNGKDAVLVKLFPVNGRRIESSDEGITEEDGDRRVFNMKVRARSFYDENNAIQNTWRKVGFIMERASDGNFYMLIHRYINFSGYDTPEGKDSVLVHIFPTKDFDFEVDDED